MSTQAPHEAKPERSGLALRIEEIDSVLLDTLGTWGSMIVGGLSLAGVGLAIGGIPGVIVGGSLGLALGAFGALGRGSDR
jgi:hypothetical protein